MLDFIEGITSQPLTLFAIILLHVLGIAVIAYDISTSNRKISNLMKATWFLAVSYTGLVGTMIYLIAGKTFEQRNKTWRQTFRSITRSLSGAGFGVLLSLVIGHAILRLNPFITIVLALLLASYASYYLAVTPLIRRGLDKTRAIKDVFYGRFASIALMSVLSVSFVNLIAPGASIADVKFWNSMFIALSISYLMTFPLNYNLVRALRSNRMREIK